MIENKFNIKLLCVLYAIFFATRLSTGAFNVIYLLNSGLNINFIVFLTVIFSISSLLFAIIIEKVGYRYSYKRITSICVLLSIFYALFMFLAPNKIALVLAEICYGFALAGMYSSIFSWLSELIKAEESKVDQIVYKTNYYKHWSVSLGSLMAIFTSSISPAIFAYFSFALKYMFLINMVIFMILYILLFFIKNSSLLKEIKTPLLVNKKPKPLISFYKEDYILIKLLIIVSLFMIAMVPIFQFWQVFFQQKLNIDIGNNNLLYYLAIFNFVTFLSQNIFNKYISKKLYFSSFMIPCIYAFISGLSLLLTIFFDGLLIIILSYFVFQGASSVLTNSLDNYILANYKDKDCLRIINSSNITQRVISIIYSLLISYFLVEINSIKILFIISVCAFLCVTILLLLRQQNSKEVNRAN